MIILEYTEYVRKELSKINRHFAPTEKFINELFDLLNKIIFKNKLHRPPIVLTTEKLLTNHGTLKVGTTNVHWNAAKIEEFLYQDVSDPSKEIDISILDIKFSMRIYYEKSYTLQDFVDILVHEMIHLYEFTNFKEQWKLIDYILSSYLKHREKFIMHSDFFVKKMKEINNEFDVGVTIHFDSEHNNCNIIDESTSSITTSRKKALMRFANVLRKSIKDDGTNSVIVTNDEVMLEILQENRND